MYTTIMKTVGFDFTASLDHTLVYGKKFLIFVSKFIKARIDFGTPLFLIIAKFRVILISFRFRIHREKRALIRK